jgi:hypothetical protein
LFEDTQYQFLTIILVHVIELGVLLLDQLQNTPRTLDPSGFFEPHAPHKVLVLFRDFTRAAVLHNNKIIGQLGDLEHALQSAIKVTGVTYIL